MFIRRRMPILLMCLVFLIAVWPWFSVRADNLDLHVRFAHLATGGQPVDLYVNGKLLVKNLKYKGVTDYLAPGTNALAVIITAAGGSIDKPLTDKPILIEFTQDEGMYFTLALVGSANDKTLELVKLPADGLEAIGAASAGPIAVSGAWARATANSMTGMATQAADQMGGMGGTSAVSAAYMVIKNAGDMPDQLIGVTCDAAAAVETHKTTVTNDVAKMEPVPAIDIPANGSVELKPGGYHIMLMQLKHDLLSGQTITLTLTFKSGVTLTVVTPIKAS